MNENDIRQLVKEEIEKNYVSGSPRIPPHRHNEVDNLKINQDDVLSGTFSMCGVKSVASEFFTIETFPNVDHINLYGVASDGLGRKAIISGAAFIGNCFAYGNQGGQNVSYIRIGGGTYSNIIQTSNSAYFDTTGAFNTTDVRVNASGSIGTGINEYIIYVKDATTEFATMKITSWTANTITFQTVLATNWSVTFFLSMS